MPRSRPRLSIPTRIFLGFAVVIGSFGALAIASLVQHARSSTTLQLVHDGYVPLALDLGDVKRTQDSVNTYLDVIRERDPMASHVYLRMARGTRPETIKRALFHVEHAEKLEPPPEDRAVLREIRQVLERMRTSHETAERTYQDLSEALDEGEDRRIEELVSAIREMERGVDRDLREARALLHERIATVSAQAVEQERQFAVMLGALSLLGLVIGAAVIWWTQRMLRPLPQLQERVAAVARGDLSAKLEPKTDDELGRLAGEFERMVEALAARDVRLREAAEAERRLQRMQEQIVTSLRAAVVVVGEDGVVRTVNPAAQDVLGLGAGAVDTPLADTDLPARLPPLTEAVQAVASGEERAVLTAVPLAEPQRGAGSVSLADDDERAVTVLVTPFGTDESGEGPRSVLVVAEDVTEELRTKARLIQTERLAAIGRMAAHVTHEVRNPLSSIGLNVEMLGDEVDDADPEAKALLRAIQREIDRLTGITEEYLRLARLPQPRLEPDDVGEVARSVGEFVRREMEEAGVELHLDVEDDLPQVAMDEPQIRQALMNLLRNAREAMVAAGGRAWLEVTRDQGGVQILVRDEGPGIPADERERIFDLFYTTKERGTGLGLPLTQQIVVAHGGLIRCEAGARGGTTFELWFPAAAPTALGAPGATDRLDRAGRPNDAFED